MPVAKAPQHRPVYYLVFGTAVSTACGSFGDSAARAAVKQLHRDGETPSTGVGKKVRDLVVEPPR
ncbi:hypothetical protein [Streptomyces sp. 3N207]|uniref:hypothetical protein n=1 Tax=Streptomyces sp. 3N207 TaxID=3457417 RepID=UPI003FCF0FF3